MCRIRTFLAMGHAPLLAAMLTAILIFLLIDVSNCYAMNTSENGKKFITRFEGMRKVVAAGSYTPYKCPAGVWTVGPGLTGRQIKQGQIYSAAAIDQMYSAYLARFENYVIHRFPGRSWNQNQFDALISFTWNLGSIRSGLYAALKTGNYALALYKWASYNKAGGRVLRGLVRRRNAEIALFQLRIADYEIR